MDRNDQRRKHTSSLPTSLHDHLYPMPPLRSTAAGGGPSADEHVSSSETEVTYEEARGAVGGGADSSHTPVPAQSFRSGQYPQQQQQQQQPPSSLSLPPTIFEGGSSAGGGGGSVVSRGEATSGSRQHPVGITSMERTYDPAADAGRSSEHHDYSHPPYPTTTPIRSSYARTQPQQPQQQHSLFNSPSTLSQLYPESFTYPPPVPPHHSSREQQQQQQQQQQQHHASLPPGWAPQRDPDTGPGFQRMDFNFGDPSRQNEWRTVTAEEARASGAYDTRRYSGDELPFAQYWPQQYDPTYLDTAARYPPSRTDLRSDYYNVEPFRKSQHQNLFQL